MSELKQFDGYQQTAFVSEVFGCFAEDSQNIIRTFEGNRRHVTSACQPPGSVSRDSSTTLH